MKIKYKFTIAILVFLIFIAGISAATASILTVDSANKTTTVNNNATYILTVNNTGTNTDTFNLTIENPQNALAELSTSSISLDAEMNGTVLLNVTNVSSGVYVVNATATSQNDSNVNATVTTTTTVNPIPGVALTVDNVAKSTVVNLNATYVLTVNNTGTNADTFNLTIENPQNAAAELSAASINLDAGMNGTVLLNVTNATSGVFVVNVTATSQANPDVNATVTTTTTVNPIPGVALTVDNVAKSTVVNLNATYVLIVNNTGTNADTFNLTIENPQNVEAGLSTSSINLDAGMTGTVLLNVTNASSGVFVVNVTATSQANPDANQTVTTTTTVNPIRGVSLAVDNPAKSTIVNLNATYVLTINNTGTNADTFNLNIENPQNVEAGLSTSSINLDAGMTGTVLLNVTNATSGVFVVNVTATSQANPDVNATMTTTTTVNPIPGVALTVDNVAKSTVVNLNATYVLTVDNTGTNADTFNLAIGNPQNAMVGLSTASISLGAGISGTVLLNVTNASSGVFVVNVTATSQINPDANQTVTTTTTVNPIPGVALTVDNSAKSTVVNLNATYVLTVDNTGTNADTFNLAIGNPQNAMVGLSTASISLGAGISGTVLLNVTNASSGVFVVNVTATSQINPDANQTVTTTTTVSPLQTTINAIVRIEPQTLNLKSKGKLTAFISLPAGFNVSDIIPGTVRLEGASAISSKVSGENGGTLVVKLNRKDLVNVSTGNAVVLTVTGKVSSQGTTLDFQGSDTIRVINNGKGNEVDENEDEISEPKENNDVKQIKEKDNEKDNNEGDNEKGNSGVKGTEVKGKNVGKSNLGNDKSEVKSNQGKGNSGGKSNLGNDKSEVKSNQGNDKSEVKSNQGNGNSGGKGNQGNGKGKK